ncbi:hypothetical protein C8R46DRAFT_1237981 [Mycena filopes]|nr:hypothetical protein C8R46DRAFT_1237981 [Mycena filopes]
MSVKEAALQTQVAGLQTQLSSKMKRQELAVRTLAMNAKQESGIAAERKRQLLATQEQLLGAKKTTNEVKLVNRALAKRVQRASGVLARAMGQTKSKGMTTKLTRRGIFTVHARQMAREMVGAELVKFLGHYRELTEVIEYGKTHEGLTNIEKNLRDGLDDVSTLTELCAMVLYQQVISHPYLRVVRGPGAEATDALDLGPLHDNVRKHIEEVIANPELIVSSDISHLTASLDGQEWEDPAAIQAIVKLMPTLPHLKDIVVAFFRGALATFIRFSSEFAPGGLIDEASASERQAAWMPATNDANEGGLGQMRNNTQDFMDALFEWPDHLYIMRLARKQDASGLERKRKVELAEFRVRLSKLRKNKELAKRQKELEDLRVLVKVRLVSTIARIYCTERGLAYTVKLLHQQLDAFRLRKVPDIKPNSTYKLKADKQAALEC